MAKKPKKPVKYLTVGQLKKQLADVPDDGVVAIYVGGADSQYWLAQTVIHDQGIIIPDINGKNSLPCISSIDNYDDDEIKGERIYPYVVIDCYE